MSTTLDTSKTIISKTTINRLISDIKTILKDPLHDNNIYYKHDDSDMLRGYAMIIGPGDTPYEYGYYLFRFNFPTDYPFSPPTLVYCTNDGNTRFNPNLYKCGKVCLSILNTWKGEQWTSCQTISSILLTLASILIENPLLNEPGITATHKDFLNYTNIIKYKNYQVAIYKIVNKFYLPQEFMIFYEVILERFRFNREKILENIEKLKTTDGIVTCSMYNMNNVKIDYTRLLIKINELKI